MNKPPVNKVRSLFFIRCCAVVVIVAATAGAYLYSGWYPIGADSPHNAFTFWALETLREQSIHRASSGVVVPADLDSPERLLAGGADYNDMCAGCHLKPGLAQSDFSLGLYPAPPNLSLETQDDEAGAEDKNARAREHFWVIKHGIKASGMPAWGYGHDDNRIWNMVAFLQRLPDLSPQQYQILTARRQGEHDHH